MKDTDFVVRVCTPVIVLWIYEDGQNLLRLYDDELICTGKERREIILRSSRGLQPSVEIIEETLSVLV